MTTRSQMFGERLAARALAVEGGDLARLRRSGFGSAIILAGIGLEIFKLQFQLIEQMAAAFGAGAILLAAQPGDLQFEVGDQRLDRTLAGLGLGKAGLGIIGAQDRGGQ